MRRLAGVALLLLSGGCVRSDVLLLPGENGAPAGAVAVLDERGGDVGVLGEANQRAALSRGRVAPRAIRPDRIARNDLRLIEDLPPPPRAFTLYFVEDSTRLMPDSAGVLAELFAEVRRRDGADVVVIGHTDTLGSGDDNDRLSRQRAGEIAALLVTQGLDPASTRAVGRGERDPLIATGDGVRMAGNRRVEVVVR